MDGARLFEAGMERLGGSMRRWRELFVFIRQRSRYIIQLMVVRQGSKIKRSEGAWRLRARTDGARWRLQNGMKGAERPQTYYGGIITFPGRD